jgi:hypothetical protein
VLLQVSQLWKEVVIRVGKEYPDVELSHMYIDNAAMQLLRNPKFFDVVVTSELFNHRNRTPSDTYPNTNKSFLLMTSSKHCTTLPSLDYKKRHQPLHWSLLIIAVQP